jgi:hypothetical protein
MVLRANTPGEDAYNLILKFQRFRQCLLEALTCIFPDVSTVIIGE